MKRRFLCIYFPNWSVDLIQRTIPTYATPSGIFLVGKVNAQNVVLRQCSRASSAGLKTGSALNLSLAFLPHALVREFDPIFDFKSLYKLCCWSNHYTPINGLDSEMLEAYKEKTLFNVNPIYYGINLDITGTERVNKGEQTLIKLIHNKMIKARFTAKMAIASTLGAAWALSRFSNQKIFISKNTLALDVKSLPVESLRLNRNIQIALSEVGIRKIEELLNLSRKEIVKRYGAKTLRQIDRIFGDEPELVTSVPMPDRSSVYREFDYPLNDSEKIVEVVLGMIDELVLNLKNKGKETNYFLLTLQGEDLWGEAFRTQKEFSLVSSSNNSKHIKNILFPLIENLSLPGPLYVFILSTKNAKKIESTQLDFNNSYLHKTSASELINQLSLEVGASNVKNVCFSNSYIPEKSFSFLPMGQTYSHTDFENKLKSRPSKLLETPVEISVLAMLPDKPPVRITLEQKNLSVLKGFGPERITESWFECSEKDLVSRDYYKIEDQNGRWLWIYRNTENSKWYLQGYWI